MQIESPTRRSTDRSLRRHVSSGQYDGKGDIIINSHWLIIFIDNYFERLHNFVATNYTSSSGFWHVSYIFNYILKIELANYLFCWIEDMDLWTAVAAALVAAVVRQCVSLGSYSGWQNFTLLLHFRTEPHGSLWNFLDSRHVVEQPQCVNRWLLVTFHTLVYKTIFSTKANVNYRQVCS